MAGCPQPLPEGGAVVRDRARDEAGRRGIRAHLGRTSPAGCPHSLLGGGGEGEQTIDVFLLAPVWGIGAPGLFILEALANDYGIV